MTIKTTFALLKASSAMQGRVAVLARSLGGMEAYGMNKPITLEQIKTSNGESDADWVKNEDSVHLIETGTAAESTEQKREPINEAVKITKKLEEAFVEVTKLEGTVVTSTVNKKEKIRTTTIKIKVPVDSDLETLVCDLEKART